MYRTESAKKSFPRLREWITIVSTMYSGNLSEYFGRSLSESRTHKIFTQNPKPLLFIDPFDFRPQITQSGHGNRPRGDGEILVLVVPPTQGRSRRGRSQLASYCDGSVGPRAGPPPRQARAPGWQFNEEYFGLSFCLKNGLLP